MANWTRILSRGNVEDRRSFSPVAVGGLSLAGVATLLVINLLFGGNLSDVLSSLPATQIENVNTSDTSQYEGADSYEVFASTVLGSNNDYWTKTLGKDYAEPKLVLFRTATNSLCGGATSDVGPHYCPLDQTIYLDETFFDELQSRFGAKGGDVAQAYVISHEVGHHAQNTLGILDAENNPIGVELQADCFAGLWANSIKGQGVLEPGEINEAMDAAAAVGDDRIQKAVNGYVNPETWTHGSSTQRVSAFNKGFSSGSLKACEQF